MVTVEEFDQILEYLRKNAPTTPFASRLVKFLFDGEDLIRQAIEEADEAALTEKDVQDVFLDQGVVFWLDRFHVVHGFDYDVKVKSVGELKTLRRLGKFVG